MFNTNCEIKRRICGKIIHKGSQIPADIHQINKNSSVIVQQKNTCKLEFSDHLWLPFIGQPQSDIVVFAIITFQIYNIIVTRWKHGIFPNDIIAFDEEI